jgi:hypothetical protein
MDGGLTMNQLIQGVSLMFKNTKAVVPVMAIALIIVLSMYFSAGTSVAAYATLQVNPAIQLAIDGEKRVVEVQALNEDAKTLSSGLKLKGTGLSEALALLADRLIESGHVTPDRKFVLSFRPAEGKANDEMLVQLAEEAKQAILVSIGRKQLANEVKASVISDKLFEAVLKEDLLPASYIEIDLLRAGFDENQVIALLQEATTLAAAYIDMIEVGVSEAAAFALIKEAIQADPSLEEVTTITSLLVDLVEKGKSESEALAAILAALKADPDLEKIDDLLNANDDSDDDEKEEEDDDDLDDDADGGGGD